MTRPHDKHDDPADQAESLDHYEAPRRKSTRQELIDALEIPADGWYEDDELFEDEVDRSEETTAELCARLQREERGAR